MLLRIRIIIAGILLRLAGLVNGEPDPIPDDMRIAVTADKNAITIHTASPLTVPWPYIHLVIEILDDIRRQIYQLWLAHYMEEQP